MSEQPKRDQVYQDGLLGRMPAKQQGQGTDTIESLKAEIAELKQERDELRAEADRWAADAGRYAADVARLTTPGEGAQQIVSELARRRWGSDPQKAGEILAALTAYAAPHIARAERAERRVEKMREALTYAVAIIRQHVPIDALGMNSQGGGDGYNDQSWPILEEYLHYMDAALAAAEEIEKCQ